MSFKILYILRHAKAVPAEGVMEDHERPLAPRGERDAVKLGEYMKQQGILPALTLCSTALRTRQTLHLVETGLGSPLNARLVSRLYLASPKDILEEIALLDDEPVHSLMIVGHNPTLHQLAVEMAGKGDEKLLDEMTRRFPTCALAEIHCPVATWDEVVPKLGTLTRFVAGGED